MQRLFQGTIEFGGQDIAFEINKTDSDQVQILVSFLKGSNTNKATFEFNKIEDNKWALDKTKTQSDINLYFKNENKENWNLSTDNLIGVGKIKLTLEKDLENKENFGGLKIKKGDDILKNIVCKISEEGTQKQANKKVMTLRIDLNKTISESKLIDKIIIKGLVKDLVRETQNKINNKTSRRTVTRAC